MRRRWSAGRVDIRPVIGAVVAAALTSAILPGCATPQGTEHGIHCEEHVFTVRVPAVSAADQQIAGELCTSNGVQPDMPWQVLLHGGAYDRTYWDWPYRPDTYSYVRHAVRAGYATLNLDRLGYGRSSRPDGSMLDFDAGATAVHGVIEQVRMGLLGAEPRAVILNGHSMGGLVATRAARLGGVDAVIVSGIPPRPSGGDRDDKRYRFHPATADPKFADRPWAAGYLTTRPGTRAEAFLYPGVYDPAILQVEEEHKDTLASAELQSVRPRTGERPTGAHPAAPEVPTAYVLGRHDSIACADADCTTDPNSVAADYVVPDSGHSINVSHGAPLFCQWTFDWLTGLGLGR
ncbi:alpha/beta hydrolase [Nocardia amamiensis]|uniref:alpha/beta hydrolase n=1 Tax=Nocardia amamiensis TaxID=404578 RepID=UPI0033F5BE13